MKPVELVSVCIRLFAINLIFSGLGLVVQMAQIVRPLSSTSTPDRSVFVVGAAIVLAVFACALLSWMFPIQIARFIVPKGVENDLNISLTAEHLEVVSLSLLGAWVLIDALPQLVHIIAWLAAVNFRREEFGTQVAGLIFRLMQIVIGSFLVLRSVGIRRVINELRTARALN